MALESLRWSEFSQLVTDHRVIDEHWHMLATIVDSKGVSNEVGQDCGTTGPGLDDLLGALSVLNVHLRKEVFVDEWALL